MVDDQIAWHLWIDLRRITPQRNACIAHDRKVDKHRHTREILEQYAGRSKFDLLASLTCKSCIDDAIGICLRFLIGSCAAQDVFEQYRQ